MSTGSFNFVETDYPVNRFAQIALTWIAFIVMFVVNVLANYLPINNYNTGQVSALYPNLFVPDGFTFSIWSIIYMWLLVFVGYVTNILIWLPGVDHRYHRIVSILPLFWVSCLLNALWILSWHYLQTGLSLLIMLLLLATLFVIFTRILKMPAHPRKRDHIIVEVPFLIYFGWISVATIANTTALLVHWGWDGGSLGEVFWTVLMMVVAAGLGVFMSKVHNRPAYTFVIIWALWGIFRQQYSGSFSTLPSVALGCILICLVFALASLFNPKKGWKLTY
ncbi:MAG: hypothetical protein MUE99_08770 [Chitinophagaceae bacterium]|nr:hypothetical protein [Chitinophagaceae bacterium]